MASMVDTVGPLAFSPEKKVPSFNNFSKKHWEIMVDAIPTILGYITIWRINCWFGIIF
jgi:hypothetical protein